MKNYLRIAATMAYLLDSRFKILGRRFGIDSLLGLIPGLGDLVSLSLALYIVWVGIKMKLPSEKIARMIGNILLDFGLGLVPVLGDIADIVFKSNLKNLEILNHHSAQGIIEGEIVG